jgi:hypothetical protein
MRAMEKDRARRYQMMAELQRDLERLLAGDQNVGSGVAPVAGADAITTPPPAGQTRGRIWVWGGAAAALVAGVAMVLARPNVPAEPTATARAPAIGATLASPAAPTGAPGTGAQPAAGSAGPGSSPGAAAPGTAAAAPSSDTGAPGVGAAGTVAEAVAGSPQAAPSLEGAAARVPAPGPRREQAAAKRGGRRAAAVAGAAAGDDEAETKGATGERPHERVRQAVIRGAVPIGSGESYPIK